MDPITQAGFDQYDAQLTATIRRHGWSIQYIGGDARMHYSVLAHPHLALALATGQDRFHRDNLIADP